jgi:hypothetical protein
LKAKGYADSYLIALVLSVVFCPLYAIAGSRDEVLVTSSDMLLALVADACGVFSFLVVKKRGSTSQSGVTHLGLFLGFLLWFLGELTCCI